MIRKIDENLIGGIEEIREKISICEELNKINGNAAMPIMSPKKYAEHIIKNGNFEERQKVLEKLKGKLILKQKRIRLKI